MQNYSGVVAGILAGYPTQIVPADQEEDGKAQLTRQAAWDIFQQNPNIGLMSKTSGNNVHGLTVDVIMDKSDGSGADIASSRPDAPGFVEITSVWSAYPPNSDPAWLSRWVTPTAELAALPGPMGGDEPEPPDPPDPPDPQPIPPPDFSQLPKVWSPSGYEPRTLGWYTEQAIGLETIYRVLFNGRQADFGGAGNWEFHIVEEQQPVDWIVEQFMESDEYKALHGE